MKQQTLAMASGFERYGKKTRRTLFLEEMEQVVPWSELCRLIEPVYAKAGNGRPPVGAERMLRIYFLQQWFNLSDPGVEEALYDSAGMRQFVGIDLGREPVPDETTVCKFRHLLEQHGLGERMFERVGEHLQQKARQERDPEMHQTRKGKQWYFGMKAHVGVDSQTKLIHSVVATAANAADCTMLPHLLHGAETRVWGDQAYRGQGEVLREHAPHALDFTNQRYRYKHYIDEVEREKNRTKSSVRSKVEHVFAVMKLKFGFVKVRYRGLDKNANRLFVTCALVNLFLVRKRLLTTTAA